MSDLKKITEKVIRFRDEREWLQFHNPKDMAISLCLEAAELLEHFQWKTPEQVQAHAGSHREELADELADVACYLLELSANLGIDLSEAIENKMKKNALKYPVEKSKGRITKYNQL